MTADPVVSPADTIRGCNATLRYAGGNEIADRSDAALDALLAVGERDKAEIARLADRAVCSGCGSDVGESGICTYSGCEEGEMIPASDLPGALRASCDRYVEEREEWADELTLAQIAGERDRQHIAQLTEALAEICRPQYELRRDRVDIARAALKAIGADPAAVLADKEECAAAGCRRWVLDPAHFRRFVPTARARDTLTGSSDERSTDG